MSHFAQRLALLVSVIPSVGGCAAYHQRILPAAVSPAPAGGTGLLRAGFGRVDITPPPGVGLAGNGPEGLPTDGWRGRLNVRALVLEDSSGERIAIAVADLGLGSASLQRLAADRIVAETGIGTDRLIFSVTHTHSGPGHYFGDKLYNDQASRVPGYDPRMEQLIVAGIAGAVRQAAGSLLPARAAWTFAEVRDLTRNRSITPYCLNDPADLAEVAPCVEGGQRRDSMTIAPQAVNTRASILRIEVRGGNNSWQPAGLLAVFAIHGTGMPNVTTVLDADIHGVTTRALDDQLRATWSRAEGTPEPIAVFANSNEGDVSPAVAPATRCARPRLGPAQPVLVHRGAEPRYDYLRAGSTYLAACLRQARDETARVGSALAREIWRAHQAVPVERLGEGLEVRRAYRSIDLTTHPGLCPAAIAGTSTIGGAEDAQTRIWRSTPLFLFGVKLMAYEGATTDPPSGCHGAKHKAGAIQDALVGEHAAPEFAQFTVARIGETVLGSVPGEVTTIAGLRMRRQIAEGAGQADGVAKVTLIGLANGFQQYVTTAEEYAAQAYEGGSNLYGPGTALVFGEVLGALAARLPRAGGGAPSPPAAVPAVMSYPGKPRDIMADSVGTERAVAWELLRADYDGHDLVLRWRDLMPGRLLPNDGSPVAVITLETASGSVSADDTDHRVVVTLVKANDRGGARYQARWTGAPCFRSGRLVLPRRVVVSGGTDRAAFEASFPGSCP